MAVIVLGLVAYLEWFGLYGDGKGECEEDEEEEEEAVTEQRWKGKINNEIGWPRETWIHKRDHLYWLELLEDAFWIWI